MFFSRCGEIGHMYVGVTSVAFYELINYFVLAINKSES